MTHDVLTIVWKEWKELLGARGGRGTLLTVVLPLGFIAVLLPLQFGAGWVTSGATLITWAWLPLFLTVSVVADAFAGERERHTLETLLASRLPDRAILWGKIAAAVIYAWTVTLAMLVVALVTVNVAHGRGELLMYSPTFGVSAVVLSLLAALLAASAGVLVSLRASSARQAQQTLNAGLLVLLFVPLFGSQLLPAEWRASILTAFAGLELVWLAAFAAIALLVADLVLLAAAAARFHRARLTFA